MARIWSIRSNTTRRRRSLLGVIREECRKKVVKGMEQTSRFFGRRLGRRLL
jgi:hypothetical protein